jgi:hypothetical protein
MVLCDLSDEHFFEYLQSSIISQYLRNNFIYLHITMVEKPASEIRIDRYNEAKQFTQYLFWDSVEIVSGFYK